MGKLFKTDSNRFRAIGVGWQVQNEAQKNDFGSEHRTVQADGLSYVMGKAAAARKGRKGDNWVDKILLS